MAYKNKRIFRTLLEDLPLAIVIKTKKVGAI